MFTLLSSELRCKHRVTGSEGSLFNLVVYPDED